MTMPEALQWAEMEQAMMLAKFEGEQDADSDDDNALTDWFLGPVDGVEPREAARAMCRMPDGDLHLCRAGCQFIAENDDGCMVCEYSGIDYGPKATRSDHCTGRSTWSSDPDANACLGGAAGALGGGWRKRPDQFMASASAYMIAKSFDDSEMPTAVEAPRSIPLKRGALCVNHVQCTPVMPKRARSQKRNSATNEGMRTLHYDASKLFERLLATRATQRRATAAAAATASATSQQTVDPRLLDQRKLFEAAVRKYVREVMSKGTPPSMDALHNLAMAVNDVVKQEQAKQQQQQKEQLALVDTRAFRSAVCDLIVSLWHASSKTPYFETAKRGADSFRSFASGVLYALKRGVTTPNETLLVPPVPEFAAALPTARAITAGDPSLKSLHAASHKGLCSLHRVIASVSAERADKVFAEPIHYAQKLAALARS